jgi:hypothetical protein
VCSFSRVDEGCRFRRFAGQCLFLVWAGCSRNLFMREMRRLLACVVGFRPPPPSPFPAMDTLLEGWHLESW